MAAPFFTTSGAGPVVSINAYPDPGSGFAYTNDPDTTRSVISFTSAYLHGAPAGAQVKLNGTNFSAVTHVRFGSQTASFTIISDSEIHATMPAGPATATVTVANSEGSDTKPFKKYFWKTGWQQAPDISIDESSSGHTLMQTSYSSTHVLVNTQPWGTAPPAYAGMTEYQDGFGNIPVHTGEHILANHATDTRWVRRYGIAVLNLELFMHSPNPTESDDFRTAGWQFESPSQLGSLVSDVVWQYQKRLEDNFWLDFSEKVAAASDNMVGKLQIRRPSPSDWSMPVLSEFSTVETPVVNNRDWAPPVMQAAWTVLDELDLTTDKTYSVDAFSSFAGYRLVETEAAYPVVRDGSLTFHPADFEDSPRNSKVWLPIVLTLDRFALGTFITEPGTADNHDGAKGVYTTGGGSWDPGVDYLATSGYLFETGFSFTYRPSRYRLLVTEAAVPDLDQALSATARAVATMRPPLHIPLLPLPTITGIDNYADSYRLEGASGIVQFDNTGTTIEGEENAFGDGHTCWFVWTAPVSGTASFDTAATPPPRWDSTIAVYDDATILPAGSPIVWDDDGLLQPGITTPDGFGTSKAVFACVAGHTYRIQVDSYAYGASFFNPSAGYPRIDARLRWSVT